MRSNALARTLVSVTAAVGIAAGGVAGASAGFAATQSAVRPAASVQNVTVLAVNNLGLSSQQAMNVQCFLTQDPANYNDAIDGQLGPNSWKAMQRWLAAYWNYPSNQIDGVVGPNTVKALQRMLAYGWGYTGGIDGDAGTGTRAAFKRFADDMSGFYPC
ncbi:peptidoglycan-binding protein [Kitasatospora sp. NPDC058162]|uniref:peptidoglycan-binding domain-containing protein n=1 Tax=Kitasatospora sp. NPDC058162 TaxID=3346362 RepID=UPI0036DC2A47